MLDLLALWALVEALGLVCLPLAVTVCRNLPDRGWSLSKTFGIALFAFCVWMPLMYWRALPYSQITLFCAALFIMVCNLVGLRWTYRTISKVARSNLVYIVATELVFLGMVFLMGWLRSFRPDVRSFETFMDEGFIAAIMRSPHLPPNDMWYAGFSINYYYYAHFTLASLAKLIGQSPSIAFNTGISICFGLTAVNLFGVTCNIVAWARQVRVDKRVQVQDVEGAASIEWAPETVYPKLLVALPAGLMTMVIGLILGNLAATQQWWAAHGNSDPTLGHLLWFNASRVINGTINEFPAFSFLLSCFHAHVLTLSFTVAAIGLAFNLFLEHRETGVFVFGRGWRLIFTLGMTALILGSLFTMNGWDFPTYLGLALVCLALQHWLVLGWSWALVGRWLSAAALLIWLSLFLFIPFYANFLSPSQGLGLVQGKDRSLLSAEFLIYGFFFFVFLSLLMLCAWKRPLFAQRLDGRSFSVVALVASAILLAIDAILLLVMPNSLTFVVMGSVAVIAALLLCYHLQDRGLAFTLLLGTLAFILVAACEVVYLRDVFADQYPRMNTIFKFYFQAWTLLSIACGCGLFFLFERFWSVGSQRVAIRWGARGGRVIWVLFLLLFLVGSMVYPLTAPSVRLARFDPDTQKYSLQGGTSLDGMAYLQTCRPPDFGPDIPFCIFDVTSDYDALRWLNANVAGDPVIVEALGDNEHQDYSLYGRVSAFTGLPTIIGWPGHELQWRIAWLNQGNNQDLNQRINDVSDIYTNSDQHSVLQLLKRYNAQYIYVGPLERIRYPQADLTRFKNYMSTVYNAEGVTIYKVR